MNSLTQPDNSGAHLYLLDVHGLIFQMYYGVGSMTAPDGRPTNAIFGVTRTLFQLSERGADYLVAALDSPEPTFREALYSAYKAHRPTPPSDLLLQEPIIYQILEAMRIPQLRQPGYEADDIMATVATRAEQRGLNVWLCTADKDCRQLISDRIRIVHLRKQGEIIDAQTLMQEWGIRPDQVIDFLALTGDSSDNVPGVSGVGRKTASRWLQLYGNLEGILQHVDQLPGGPKVRQALREAAHKSTLQLSRQLVTLDRNVPLTCDWERWRRQPWDYPRLLDLFHQLGFRTFSDRLRKMFVASAAATSSVAATLSGNPAAATLSGKSPAATPPALFQTAATALTDTPASQSAAAGATEWAAPATASPSKRTRRKTLPANQQVELFSDWENSAAVLPSDNWSYDGYQLVQTSAQLRQLVRQLRQQKRLALDLETAGLDPFQDPIIGYAFCWQAGQAYYLPLRAPAGEKVLSEAQVRQTIQPILEDPNIAKVNHNIKFDLKMLQAHGITLAGIAGDSMIAHYLLEPGAHNHGLDQLTYQYLQHRNIPLEELIQIGSKKTGKPTRLDQVPLGRVCAYACEDADTAWRLTQRLEGELQQQGLAQLYADVEIPLIRVLADMELTGIGLDVPFLQSLSAAMAEELAGLEAEIYQLAGRPFPIGSLRELQKVLFEELKLPVRRRTGIKNEPSTDQETLERLAAEGHALPKKLIEYRQLSKLKNTYVDVLPQLVHPRTGRIHTSFNQTATETGRLSSSEPNLQNIPARTERGAQLRKAFIPRPGWQLISADYSQIELRLLAHFSGDPTLRRAFIDDQDVHTAVAAEIFQVAPDQVTKHQRAMAKTVNFGVIYGMSAAGLSARLSIPREQAQAFIDAYFQRYPKVLEYQQRILAQAHQSGCVTTILGRQRRFHPAAIRPNSDYRNRSAAEREAINMPIQGSAADLLKRAMVTVYQQLQQQRRQAKLLLTVHDELVLEAPAEEISDIVAMVRQQMSTALPLDVPLKVDVAVGPNWLEVEEWRDGRA
jgi:DNA polymerase-1